MRHEAVPASRKQASRSEPAAYVRLTALLVPPAAGMYADWT